jgi:hypothetical protein
MQSSSPSPKKTEQRRGLPNGARSIMSSRIQPTKDLDFSPTPPWATRALMEHVMPALGVRDFHSAWESACGKGHMAEPLREYFGDVIATDIFDHGYGSVHDFLDENEC